ncbi:ketoacyl-ACP synthase III [Paractinoplanes ferrugineus]|uniref:3-oxoacyl-[acyl-carrier-protein] synthase 3 n=1 Tax=Paractinoplanes ferrugineus TaxID=113564 RepID=A0A919J739_9ACTN|nr:ketoacyl-ACP synthase III [Actinoplanes ferrugineus]GIE11796.1 3-oxoacyl-[acyl-carrier-protein] synthase 3 [Actinoplanes ferrugineus]
MAVGILGTGSYVPQRVVTNVDLNLLVPDADPEWVARKTLIEARRFAAPHEAASDLAAQAARAALAQAGVAAAEIDYIVLATSTGDSPQPPTSNLVQNRIGANRAACFDLNAVCSGWIFALSVANGLVAANPGALVLVLATDIYSRILDFTDRRTAVLFGDGAGAAVVGAVPDGFGIIDLDLRSQGDSSDLIYVKGGGSRHPLTADRLAAGDQYFRMNGRGVRDFVAAEVPPALEALLTRAGLKATDVDHFVPHQANGIMLQELVAAAGFENAHTHLTLPNYGNMGSASVPVTLDHANRSGALKRGDLLLLAGFGGGMSMGAALIRWSN